MRDTNSGGSLWRLYKMGGFTPAITSMFNAQSAQQMAFIRSMMKEQRKQSLYDIKLECMELVVFDLETTGFSPYNGDEIISFGAISVVGDTILDNEMYYSLVNPKRSIPSIITDLTGITEEMVTDAPDLLEALRGFLEFVKRKVLIAHGSGHDKHFLNAALWRTSKTQLKHRLIDTMMIAKWLHPKREKFDLDSLLELYEIEISQRHNALQDSIMTAQLWAKMLPEIREREVYSLGDLYWKLGQQP